MGAIEPHLNEKLFYIEDRILLGDNEKRAVKKYGDCTNCKWQSATLTLNIIQKFSLRCSNWEQYRHANVLLLDFRARELGAWGENPDYR